MLPIVIECRKETPEKGVEAFLEQLKSNLGREDNMPWADLGAAEWELLLLRHPEYEKHLGSAILTGWFMSPCSPQGQNLQNTAVGRHWMAVSGR